MAKEITGRDILNVLKNEEITTVEEIANRLGADPDVVFGILMEAGERTEAKWKRKAEWREVPMKLVVRNIAVV